MLFVTVMLTGSGAVLAQTLPPDVTLAPTLPKYFVTRDAFVRAAPDNEAERLGSVAKGRPVAVAGKALVGKSKEAHWIAVKLRDGRIGFVFAAALTPMIDGTLRVPLDGTLAAPGRPDCGYTVVFEGKSQVADDIQRTADYDVVFACTWRGTALEFNAGMFITELPFQEGRTAFQINIDLWDVRVNDEDVLSVTAVYDPIEQQVVFDRVSDDTMGSGEGIAPMAARDVPAALAAALSIAHRTWQEKAWQALAELPKPAADAGPTGSPTP